MCASPVWIFHKGCGLLLSCMRHLQILFSQCSLVFDAPIVHSPEASVGGRSPSWSREDDCVAGFLPKYGRGLDIGIPSQGRVRVF